MRDAPRGLQRQFVDLGQQLTAARTGIWIFLISELMLFGGLFTGYSLYRSEYPHAFALGSNALDFWAGTANTAVLLVSSATVAIALHFARRDRQRALRLCLAITLLLGATFLVIKGYEYHHKWETGLVPTDSFTWTGPPAQHVRMFFAFYFVMTATHALHMVAGMIVIATVWWSSRRGRFSSDYYAPVETAGLYWHFVDIVWIFLYPLLYLLGRHTL